MAANRITRYQSRPSVAPAQYDAPKPLGPAVPHGFALCPPQVATANTWQQEIYRLAYEQAQATTQIPRHHRVLFSVWN